RVGAETLLAQIVRMVAEAQRSRAPIQKLADRVAAVFVPAVLLVAVLTFVIWAIRGPEPRMAYAIVNAVAVLIIACPCALGLAAAIVRGAGERGIQPARAESFESRTGSGVVGKVEGHVVALGNRRLLEELDMEVGGLAKKAEALRADGATVLLMAVDGKPAGV